MLLLRRALAALAVLVLPLPALAEAPADPARPALWKVSDRDTTIYLFGTIHALPKGISWLTGPVAGAVKGAQELVTEIPETSQQEMQAIVLSSALLPAGQSLRGLLVDEDRARFEKAVSSYGLPVESFDRYKPWYAAVALSTLPLARQGYTREAGVEDQLIAMAKGKPHQGLETAAYQLGLFDSLGQAVQLHYLNQVVAELPRIDGELAAILEQWKLGHPDKLAELMNEDQDDPQMIAVLLTQRNTAWAQWIRQRMAKPGVVFLAVGAGHLAGPGSVLEQLQAQGLKVARVQ